MEEMIIMTGIIRMVAEVHHPSPELLVSLRDVPSRGLSVNLLLRNIFMS